MRGVQRNLGLQLAPMMDAPKGSLMVYCSAQMKWRDAQRYWVHLKAEYWEIETKLGSLRVYCLARMKARRMDTRRYWVHLKAEYWQRYLERRSVHMKVLYWVKELQPVLNSIVKSGKEVGKEPNCRSR